MTNHFHNLFTFGRPASGKSEFIDSMKKCDPTERLEKFHIAPFEIIDDFLFLKDMNQNETILEKFSIPRRVTKTTSDGIVVLDDTFFGFVSQKINMVYGERYTPNPKYYDTKTLLIEFSRGATSTNGYKYSLSNLNSEILKCGSIIYIKTSYKECLRRNEARYQEKLKHSVLAHKVPVEAMERFYQDDDWNELTNGKPSGFVTINNILMPFVTLDNESESKDLRIMSDRYASALHIVFELTEQTGL
jgi:hypothetical protein